MIQRFLRMLRVTRRQMVWYLRKIIPLRSLPAWQPFRRRSASPVSSFQSSHFPFRLVAFTTLGLVLLYFASVTLAGRLIYQHRGNSFSNKMEAVFPYPAAVVNRSVIPLSRLRWEMQAREFYKTKNNLSDSSDAIEKYILDQISNRWLYQEALAKEGISITDTDVNQKMQTLLQSRGSEADLLRFLQSNYGNGITLEHFRIWIRETLAESAVEEQLLEHATVRHIVISLPDNPSDTQVAMALQRAKDVKGKITSPEQFAAVAKEFSDDLASRDKGGLLGTTRRGEHQPDYLTADFEKAIFELPIGTVSDPIRTPKGWHLLMIDKREGPIKMSMADFTAKLRAEAKIRYFL